MAWVKASQESALKCMELCANTEKYSKIEQHHVKIGPMPYVASVAPDQPAQSRSLCCLISGQACSILECGDAQAGLKVG